MVQDVEYFEQGPSRQIRDLRYEPIAINIWSGVPNLDMLRDDSQWMVDESGKRKPDGRVLVLIHDMSGLTERPSPEMRKFVSELEMDRSVIVSACAVISNSLVRGAITAINWVRGDSEAIEVAGTIQEAIAKTSRILQAKGFAGPDLDASAYLPPTWQNTAANQ